jgi:hypothetical protein
MVRQVRQVRQPGGSYQSYALDVFLRGVAHPMVAAYLNDRARRESSFWKPTIFKKTIFLHWFAPTRTSTNHNRSRH